MRKDQEQIEGLFAQIIEGWNAGSAVAMASPFSGRADYVAFDGTHTRGRDEIAASHRALFDRFLRGTQLVGKLRSVRFLTEDVALLHAVGSTLMPGESDLAPDRNSVQTLVAVRRESGWELEAFHNTRAVYMGRPEEAAALTEELRSLL
jgi:uncharacterized protein (TIGR02246 family)